MTLTLDSFETAVQQVNNKVGGKTINHYILNVSRGCSDVVGKILNQIDKSTDGQVLYKMDLRTIFHPSGSTDNFSIEACTPVRSLASVGASPTA